MSKLRAIFLGSCPHDNERYYRCPACNKTFGSWSILRALVLASTNYMPCLSYMQDPDIIRAEAISTQYDTITVSLVVKRANFLGDTDYSEEDIEKYKNMVDNMCRDILRMINKEEPQLIWSTN